MSREERVLVVASDLSTDMNVFPTGSLGVDPRQGRQEELSCCAPPVVLSKTVEWCQSLVAGGPNSTTAARGGRTAGVPRRARLETEEPK